jgi:hypothetical protein
MREADLARQAYPLPEGIRTEIISASILPGDDLAGYDPAQDTDLYEYFLTDEQEFRTEPMQG